MATIKNFEDLQIWQESRIFIKEIYTSFSQIKDFGFRDQIQRASVSVMNNIAEGFERDSDKEFARFLFIAKASCGEVRSMLYLACDLELISSIQKDNLIEKSKKISIGINKLIIYLNKSIKS